MELNNERAAKWLPRMLGLLFLLPVVVVLIHPGLRVEIMAGVEILTSGDLEGSEIGPRNLGFGRLSRPVA